MLRWTVRSTGSRWKQTVGDINFVSTRPPAARCAVAIRFQFANFIVPAWKSIVLEARVKYFDFVPKYHHEVSWSRPRRPLSFLCFAAERRAASGPGCLFVSKVIGWVGGVWWETTLAAQILGVLVPGGNCARSPICRARAQIEPEPASDHSFTAQGPQQQQQQPRGQRTLTIPRCREHERKSR